MKKSFVFSNVLSALVGALVLLPQLSHADLEWSGVYRFEANSIMVPGLSGSTPKKEYGLHHLVLRPKIVASDGLTIHSQFHVFNENSGNEIYGPSQLGQTFGTRGFNGTQTTRSTNTMAENQAMESFLVSELYITLAQEFGSLIVGRAPLQFGLGMTHNAGKGLFDHWFDTRDLVGYKMVMGNMFFLPMYGKVKEGAFNRGDEINDLMLQFQYENPESDLELGFFYQKRSADDPSNDTPVFSGTVPGGVGGTGAQRGGGMNMTMYNLYALKDNSKFRFGAEVSFMDGESGVLTATSEKVKFNGFAAATEFEYRPEAGKWKYGLKGGYATGDDPSTDNTFEGYAMDRNYDVAFLMFNHPLGQTDLLRSGFWGGGPGTDIGSTADTEVISNVLYLSPYAKYQWSDKLFVNGSLTTGWLNVEPVVGTDVKKDLGFELDLALSFEPRKGVRWINEVGLLFPGAAFKAGGTFEAAFAYGLTSKAAISF